MEEVDAMLQRLDHDNVEAIRDDIATLIRQCLERARGALGYWEKSHFVHAIAALSWNIHSNNQPTTFWLRLSLVELENAFTAADRRNENYVRLDDQVNALTFEQLVQALDEVRFVR